MTVPSTYKVITPPPVQNHVQSIATSKARFSSAAMDRFLDELDDKYELLEVKPYLWSQVPGKDYRKITLDEGTFRLLYVVDEPTKTVLIVAIVHKSQVLP